MVKSFSTLKCSLLLAGFALLATGCLPRGTNLGLEYAPIDTDLSHVDYAALRKNVLVPAKCLDCHDEFNSENGVLKYVAPGDPEHSPLYLESANGDMPPPGSGPKLTDQSLAVIRAYINQVGNTPE